MWLVRNGFFLPSIRARWCTRELKIIPMSNFHGDKPYTHAIGIRADEQNRLKKKENIKKGEEVLYPLIEAEMDRKEVVNLCKKHDMLNPVYQWRTNVSCFCCPFQSLQNWRNLYKKHPQLFKVAEEWEEMSRLNSNGNKFNFRNDNWSLKAIREIESRQLSLF